MKKLLYIFVVLIAFASCKPGIPSNVLSEGDMVDVLYDMHVAQAMYENSAAVPNHQDIIALRASVLEKHGLTKAEWDSSYVFYCGHADYLNEVYTDLLEKMNENVEALGGKVEGMENGDAADTANIWKQENHCVLMRNAPYNAMTFSIIPDTSVVKDGDRINLQYDAQMVFQDHRSDVTVCLNIYYDNDSIATRVNHVNGDGPGILSISNDVDRLRIRKITGFFLLTKQFESNAATGNIPVFQLAVIRNIKLLHLHTDVPAPPSRSSNAEQHPDSMQQPQEERHVSLSGSALIQ